MRPMLDVRVLVEDLNLKAGAAVFLAPADIPAWRHPARTGLVLE